MKAITIKQPWASLIVHGIKDIENRTWQTNFRGRVLIHSSSKGDIAKYGCLQVEQRQKTLYSPLGKVYFNDLPFGAIIGSVEIVDCVQNHPSLWAEKGVYNWVLANPILYEEPIENVKGKLSFWNYPDINEVKIECPECGSIEIAVEDHTTMFGPFHCCNKCGHMITESDWERVSE